MNELFDSLYSDNLVLLCVIMGVVALVLAIAIFIEIYNSNKKKKKDFEFAEEFVKEVEPVEEKVEPPKEEVKLNIKESSDIKYVEEDQELEKTKAQMELARLREKLRQEEEEKSRLLALNIELEKKANDDKGEKEEQDLEKTKEIKIVSPNITPNVTASVTPTINKEELLDKARDKILPPKVVTETKENKFVEVPPIEKIEDTKEEQEVPLFDDYPSDEETAIISYDELEKAEKFGYTDEEMDNYVDEKDAIISIQELEKLYSESQKIEVPTKQTAKVEFEMKRVEELPKIADNKKFQTSPFISPVYGKTKTETDRELVLENTANLEKLNDEIRKTNEFLKTLKDLRKNLQ